MPYNSDLLNVIDYRIAQNTEHITAMGTVTWRSTGFYDTTAMVTFDGSDLAVPVKLSGSVEAFEGDRVGLVKFGSEWVVVMSFTRRWPKVQSMATITSITTGETGSGTFVEMPSAATIAKQFPKLYDETWVHMAIQASAFASVAGTAIAVLGLRFTYVPTGAVSDHRIINKWVLNDSANHYFTAAENRSIAVFAAGTYDVRPIWAKDSGAANPKQDSNDTLSFTVTEVGP